MKIRNICILTKHVKKLTQFYSNVFQSKPKFISLDYVEFEIGNAVLAIFNVDKHNSYVQVPAKEASNQSVIIELEVDNVDEEYQRICSMEIPLAKQISTQDWGSRSFYFFDPDRNLINFFSRNF